MIPDNHILLILCRILGVQVLVEQEYKNEGEIMYTLSLDLKLHMCDISDVDSLLVVGLHCDQIIFQILIIG